MNSNRARVTPSISCVVPAYNESDNLPPLLQRLSERLAGRFAT